MIFCMNCGNKLTVGYQFCTHCGEVQEQGMPINSQVIPPVSKGQQRLAPHVTHQAMPTSVRPQSSNTDYMGNLITRGCGTDADDQKSYNVVSVALAVIGFIVVQVLISVLSDYHNGGYGVWVFGFIIPPSLLRIASTILAVSYGIWAVIGYGKACYESEILVFENGIRGKTIEKLYFEFKYNEIAAVYSKKENGAKKVIINANNTEFHVWTIRSDEIAMEINKRKFITK